MSVKPDTPRPAPSECSALGFDLMEKDTSNTHFVMLRLVKAARASIPPGELRVVRLKPCIYKKR